MKPAQSLLFGLLLMLGSCSHEEKSTHPYEVEIVTTYGHDTQSQSPPAARVPSTDSIQVSGTVYYRTGYCEGAYPSPEVLAERKKARLFQSGQLYFKGKSGQSKVSTDRNGKFNCYLKPGAYQVYLASNKTPEGNVWYNEEVDGRWWAQQAFAHFNCDSSSKKSSLVLDFTCPPSARKRP